MELLVVFQTSRSARKPVVLVGRRFWQGLIDWLTEELGSRQFIDLHNTDFIKHADDEREVLAAMLGQAQADALLLQHIDVSHVRSDG
jgi:predicted Rossmann-fold nucleotide-binding protein